VIVDTSLNGAADAAFTVVANTAETIGGSTNAGAHPVGSTLPVRHDAFGAAFVEIRNLAPTTTLVLTNRP
jgi:hypothetical protein